MDFLASNIEFLAHERRVSVSAFAEVVGMSQPTLNRLYNGKTEEPRNKTLKPLADFAGVTVEELRNVDLRQRAAMREQWRSTEGTSFAAAEEPTAIEYTGPTLRPLLAWEHEKELPPGDFVAIPRMAVNLSAGEGYEQAELELIKDRPQVFSADWVRRMRLQPKALRVMYADGNSMEPRIQDGDALVIDLSQTSVVDGRVYAIYYSGGERVKRLTMKPSGGLVVASDNPEHQTLDLSAEEAANIKILGRVVNTSGHKGL